MEGRRFIPARTLFVIATAFGISSTLQAHWMDKLELHPHVIQDAIARLLVLNLVYWYIPALLAPLIMAFALRHPFDRIRWPRQLALHVTAALSYSVVHTTSMMGVRALLLMGQPLPPDFPGWRNFALLTYLTQLDWLLMTYLFLIGLAYALAYRRESEARALNTSQLETRLVEAQLQALQRQLHPHFLFNTLNTVSGLIRTDPDAADTMIDRLGDLLRMTLHKSGIQEVSLKEELDVLGKYVEIERTRFGNRLTVEMRVQPETLDVQVPSLVLQPLVENAIRHGIAPNAGPGWIAVYAQRDNDDLVLQVLDNGDGLPPDRLMAMNRGVGLDNTRARLEHLYRDRFEFTFSNLERGFCVTIRIPFEVQAPAGSVVGAA
ncbi:MAG TPA: sensor histidine kinase [Vicinamibacterales bacterium]|nr:sensor histidine kinase [Vicinamibacterales bacterium]